MSKPDRAQIQQRLRERDVKALGRKREFAVLLPLVETEEGLAVGLFNLSADYVLDAEIETEGGYDGLQPE